MFRSPVRRRSIAVALIASMAAVVGCATGGPNPAICAVAAGALGGGGGYLLGNTTPGPDTREEAIYGSAGAILGASAGYLICKAMQKEAPPPPPPVAKPAPKPAPPPPAPVEEKIVLRGVNFDFDKADIRPDAAVILDEAASILNQNSGKNVSVAGHTDSVGADEYNQKLSEQRAYTVRDYLVSQGVAANAVSAIGLGKGNPVASNDTAAGRQQNRRVELVVSGEAIGIGDVTR